ncbi:MAG: NAD(P)/FAD-dependent oxidoreductase [Candidatus Algichlamydia australiensis]|nr:NAD(P)/FAD-dependent oxidoreductase [Chlamydiales bacterium]
MAIAQKEEYDLIILGGGAAGIFAACHAAKFARVLVVEKTAQLLSKVRISGGGRCNVTHSCFDPRELTQNYPRGSKELLGPFHKFGPQETIDWFSSRGVKLKTEKDGRMFPVTNSSETIINCLLKEAETLGVEIRTRTRIQSITKTENGFQLDNLHTKKLLLATGSSFQGHNFAKSLGHTIIDPVPSLFTFNVPNSPLKELSGISVPAKLTLDHFTQTGPLLITHFGFSGPAALKLSAFAARHLAEKKYCTPLTINWLPNFSPEQIKNANPKKLLSSENLLPKSLWKTLIGPIGEKKIATLSNQEIGQLTKKLQADTYQVEGKTTNKEEFVTCGGIPLREVNFKTMESKICPGLHFAGEILDIDGVTGGFNFQNAWTTSFLAGTKT